MVGLGSNICPGERNCKALKGTQAISSQHATRCEPDTTHTFAPVPQPVEGESCAAVEVIRISVAVSILPVVLVALVIIALLFLLLLLFLAIVVGNVPMTGVAANHVDAILPVGTRRHVYNTFVNV